MRAPFEDPRKADLRARAVLALEASGHKIEDDPKRIEIPVELGLKGAIVGDIRSTDTGGVVHAFYVRSDAARPLPQWLANLARASQSLTGVRVFVIAEGTVLALEQSCRACGAGLLVLVDDGEYRLDVRVDPSEFSKEAQAQALTRRIYAARRDLDQRLDLALSVAKERYLETVGAVNGMSPKRAEVYMARAEEGTSQVGSWAEALSERLDQIGTSGDVAELDVVERLIREGPDVVADGV